MRLKSLQQRAVEFTVALAPVSAIVEKLLTLRMQIHLVTGSAGFLGSHLIDRLMEVGDEVICLDIYFTGRKSNIALDVHPGSNSSVATSPNRSSLRWTGSGIWPVLHHRFTISSIRSKPPRPVFLAPTTCWDWPGGGRALAARQHKRGLWRSWGASST